MRKIIIFGIGNPGEKYENTRHNIGWKVLDNLCKYFKVGYETSHLGKVAIARYNNVVVYFIKSSNPINSSGETLKYYSDTLSVDTSDILVITDDINIKFNSIRYRDSGSSGGHNGLKDIEKHLDTQLYHRLRIGVSNNFEKGKQVEYVLSEFSEEEKEKLENLINIATGDVINWLKI